MTHLGKAFKQAQGAFPGPKTPPLPKGNGDKEADIKRILKRREFVRGLKEQGVAIPTQGGISRGVQEDPYEISVADSIMKQPGFGQSAVRKAMGERRASPRVLRFDKRSDLGQLQQDYEFADNVYDFFRYSPAAGAEQFGTMPDPVKMIHKDGTFLRAPQHVDAFDQAWEEAYGPEKDPPTDYNAWVKGMLELGHLPVSHVADSQLERGRGPRKGGLIDLPIAGKILRDDDYLRQVVVRHLEKMGMKDDDIVRLWADSPGENGPQISFGEFKGRPGGTPFRQLDLEEEFADVARGGASPSEHRFGPLQSPPEQTGPMVLPGPTAAPEQTGTPPPMMPSPEVSGLMPNIPPDVDMDPFQLAQIAESIGLPVALLLQALQMAQGAAPGALQRIGAAGGMPFIPPEGQPYIRGG